MTVITFNMALSGSILDFFVVFWAGVLVSFTPCVYPVMPITASFIAGANISGRRRSGFILSLIYVLGLAISYCMLAIFAVGTGKIFGQLQNTPLFYGIIGCSLVTYGLIMLDVIRLPNLGWQFKQDRPKSIWAVLIFGMTSGLIVGPCTAPVLATLLTYVASKQNLFYGISLLFVFSYGVGASLIVVGTFSGLLTLLPKSGRWLERIKQFSGGILVISGLYFFYKTWTAMALS
jgi:cytochrome c-type biogenesis protein